MTGAAFRKQRLRLQLSQEQLAPKLGVTLRTVQRWEQLEQVPEVAALALKQLAAHA